MFFDDYNLNGNRNTPPDEKNFIKKLLELVDGKRAGDYSVGTEELTRDMQIILRDEFNAEVLITQNNVLSLLFTNGEKFTVKIEKTGFYLSV